MKTPREKSESPLSLRRITEAFAQMLGRPAAGKVESKSHTVPMGDTCPICPRSILEAILFVGSPDREAFSSDELALTMRDVTPTEVEATIAELNRAYEADGAPYCVVASGGNYRLSLRSDYQRLGYKLQGKAREAKLSPQALEVLALVAYRQPLTAAEIEGLRKVKSGGVLAQLVRRGLLKLDRSLENSSPGHYSTTERFLRLFGLASLSQLPQAAEIDFSAA